LSDTKRRFMVRFEQGLFDRIEALADKRNCKPSDVIRAAVVAYLADSALDATSHRRLARISEFLQLAVDVMISEQYPEYRERIIANTDKRLEQYHGA
jgi:metal-responsive CopG/Arc/MetJ family transcriptional regulator